MPDDSESMQIIEWFRSLSLGERQEKVKSLKEFFSKNTIQLLKTVRSLESITDCPSDLITTAKKLVSNNMHMISTLDRMEEGVNNAKKKIDDATIETDTTAAGK
jgi:Na+/phosphate symporter